MASLGLNMPHTPSHTLLNVSQALSGSALIGVSALSAPSLSAPSLRLLAPSTLIVRVPHSLISAPLHPAPALHSAPLFYLFTVHVLL